MRIPRTVRERVCFAAVAGRDDKARQSWAYGQQKQKQFVHKLKEVFISMKRLMLVLMVVVVGVGIAVAQIDSNYQSPTDVQGAHLNHGRGCTGCHIPHSGPGGNGLPNSAFKGNHALWAQDPSPLFGKTLAFGDKGNWTVNVGGDVDTVNTPDVTGVIYCLSCHDGNLAKGAMMTGIVAEKLPPGYASKNIPTWLGNDGSGVNNYQNDHPVGLTAVMGCNPNNADPSSHNWDCTIDGTGKVLMTGTQSSQFVKNYGFTVSPAKYNNQPVVLCTTCHNQHVMTVYKGKIANVQGYYKTYFGIRGYYNPVDGSNSTTQFCRNCHGSHANEFNNTPNVPTT
jgi:hypothetical protein